MSKKEKILKWLQDNGVYEQFCKCAPNQELYIDENLIEVIDWDRTPEGFDFWDKINNEFYDWYLEEFADEFLYINFKKDKS